MEPRQSIELAGAAGLGARFPGVLSAQQPEAAPDQKLMGMYVHECWVYHRPYAARSWTDGDWHGYLEGLARLGYNLVTVWPQLEVMPRSLTASDQAKLDQHRRLIDMAHDEFGMKVWIAMTPNIVVNDDYAGRMTFEQRSFFAADVRVNPGDQQAVAAMMARRAALLKPLAAMDGLVVIDSDPGGYPGSTNKEFVDLLVAHRRLLDRLRPGGIELVYWMWAGWQAYARYYTTGDFAWQTDAEFVAALALLKEQNPEPWGLASGLEYARKIALESKVVSLNYGAIEAEPSFPMTNFTSGAGGAVYQSGQEKGPRGAQANAQTHCVQLPGTFAFARGAKGLPLADKDYIAFANDLIPGCGERIVSCWQALASIESERIKDCAAQLAPLVKTKVETGPLRGFLFGDPNRFLNDLYVMLRLKAASVDFIKAAEQQAPIFGPLGEFVSWLDRWHVVTGYDAWWNWFAGCDVNASLKQINDPALGKFFQSIGTGNLKAYSGSARQRIAASNCGGESETLRLLGALKRVLWEMDPQLPGSTERSER